MLGTKLAFDTAFHPHTYEQTKRVNQIMEDMHWACALTSKEKKDKILPYDDLSCNKNYQLSI